MLFGIAHYCFIISCWFAARFGGCETCHAPPTLCVPPTAFRACVVIWCLVWSPLSFACLSDRTFATVLQVVFSLVEPAGDMYALPGDLIDANEWVRVFLRTGGMQHLLILLGKDGGIDPSQVRMPTCSYVQYNRSGVAARQCKFDMRSKGCPSSHGSSIQPCASPVPI